MIVRSTCCALVLSALAFPAAAQQAQTTQPKKLSDPNRTICRRAAPTGSLVPAKKDCRTQAQWDAEATTGNRNTREMMDRQSSSAQGPL